MQVLSYNLCTVMRIPHDPGTFEEHFKNDDEGPLSNQGYMPYLNRYILDKVRTNSFTSEPKTKNMLLFTSNVFNQYLLIIICALREIKLWFQKHFDEHLRHVCC